MNFGVEFQKNFYNILEEIHMKIGVMSDTHGSLPYLEKALDGHEYAVTDYATFVPYIYGRKDSVDSLLKGQGKGQFYF